MRQTCQTLSGPTGAATPATGRNARQRQTPLLVAEKHVFRQNIQRAALRALGQATSGSRGVKRQNRNKSLLFKLLKYFPNCVCQTLSGPLPGRKAAAPRAKRAAQQNCVSQNNNGFLYCLAEIKIVTKLSGLLVRDLALGNCPSPSVFTVE